VAFNIKEEVSITTIDDYCAEKSIEHIDLLKVDVEGHEMSVFQGSARMLGENRVSMLAFEVSSGNVDTRVFFKEFYHFLKPLGFEIYRLTRSGYLFPIKNYSEHLEQFRATMFYAIRNDVLHAAS